ncbi:MAG: ATP-binding protein [Muribaculaceae bacterium]
MSNRRSPYLVGKAFRGFLLASVLTAAASQVGVIVDGIMLARFINEGAMSAINITSPVNQFLFSLCILLGIGGTMIAGMAIGNHERPKASAIFSVVAVAAIALGVALGASGLALLQGLTSLLCPDAALQAYTADYLRVLLPGAPAYMLMLVTQMFVTLDGAPRRVTAAVCTSMAVNLALDYVFIVWCGWGMTGAAAATVASYIVALAVLLPHFAKKTSLKFRLPSSFASLRQIVAMGLPFGITTALIAVQIFGNNLVAINYLGSPGIVTLSICLYLLMFSMIILSGTLESFQPVAAILKGAGDNKGVALVLGRAYLFLTSSLLILCIVLMLFPQWIAGMFGISDPASASMMRQALPAFAVNIVLHCAIYLLIPVYQIYSHKALAYVISIGQPLLPMLCFWVLSGMVANGDSGVNPWWGFAAGQLIVAAVLLPMAMVKRGGRMPIVLIDSDNPDEFFDVSLEPKLTVMNDALISADSWMKDNGIDDTLRIRVQLACEETVKNIIGHALKERGHTNIDLCISLMPDKVKAMIRDEGIPFNPVEQDPGTGLGLMIIRKICDREQYEYLFHQNLLTIEWDRPATQA